MIVELRGEELVLVLLVVSEAVVVLVKILLPGTVRGLFTAPNTGAGLGCIVKENSAFCAQNNVANFLNLLAPHHDSNLEFTGKLWVTNLM